jgi:hypothetical protein
VLKSVNHGATWTSVSTGLPSAPATSIVYDAAGGAYYVAMWGQGVYKSTNGGAGWAACGTVAIGTNKDVYSLRLAGGKLYALLSAQKSYTNPGGLFVSSDGGATWGSLASNAAGAGPLYYPTEFEVNPGDSSEVYIAAQDAKATSGGLYQTLNNGASWSHLAMPVGATPYGWGVAIDPGNTATAYFSTENQGFFQSVDNGATWARVSTLPFGSVQRMTFAANATYVTTFGCGVWKQPLAVVSPSPSPGPSPLPTATGSFTLTRTPSPTATASASPSASPTASPPFTGTPSSTASGTRSSTPTSTPTWTASPTQTLSPTFSATPTFSASPTPRPAAGVLLEAVTCPNPWSPGQAAVLDVKLSGRVDALEFKLYTAAFRCVASVRWDGSLLKAGWNNLPLALDPGEANGVYFACVKAQGSVRRLTWMILR